MKKDISPLSGTDMLSRITALQGVNFRWKTQTDDTLRYGFIAQDVEKIFPEFVSTDEKGLRSVAYGAFTPALVEAIKAQQTQIDGLKLVLSATGAIGNASSTSELASGGGVGQWLAKALETLGLGLQNGVASLKEVVADSISSKTVNTEQMCIKGSDGETVCVSKDELKQILQNSSQPVNSNSAPEKPEKPAVPEETSAPAGTPAVESAIAPAAEPVVPAAPAAVPAEISAVSETAPVAPAEASAPVAAAPATPGEAVASGN
jgi:hypothetical protein